MCVVIDSVFTICVHDDFLFNITLCDDKVCKGRVDILRLIPGWCTECRKALMVRFKDEKSLRDYATPRRAWASLAQIGKVEMIKPMLPAMVASPHLDKLDIETVIKAEALWAKELIVKICGLCKHQVEVGNEHWDPVGVDKPTILELVKKVHALTDEWVG